MRKKKTKNYKKPRRAKKKKSILRSKIFWIILSVFLLTDTISYFAVFSPRFQMSNIQISGNQKVNSKDIESLVKETAKKNIIFIETKSIFLADVSKIAKSILNKYPLVENVEAKIKLPTGLEIKIKERTGVATFCSNQICSLIDRKGIVFEAGFAPGGPVVIKDQSREINPGEAVIDEKSLNSLIEIYKTLEDDIGIEAKDFIISKDDKVIIETKEGWVIYSTLKEEISWQITKLKMVLEKEIPLEKRPSLEYIDLRFGNIAAFRYVK